MLTFKWKLMFEIEEMRTTYICCMLLTGCVPDTNLGNVRFKKIHFCD